MEHERTRCRQGRAWFARWLRDQRARLGYSREQLVTVCRRRGGDITIAILQDVEREFRLPTRIRGLALAAGLGLRPWLLDEIVRLAPVVEPAWWNVTRTPVSGVQLLEWSRLFLAAGMDARAVACAELAARHARQRERRRPALLLWGAGLLGVDFPELAKWCALEVLAARPGREERFEAALLAGESAAVLGRVPECRLWLESLDSGTVARDGELAPRVALARARLALAGGHVSRAAALALEAVEGLAPRSSARRGAVDCLVASMRRQGREAEALRWRERLLVPGMPIESGNSGVARRGLGD